MSIRTTQLRRYELPTDGVDEFLAWWRSQLLPARLAHGFKLEMAWLDRDGAEFVWAVSVPGAREEFDRVEAVYLDSPERALAFEAATVRAQTQHVSFVDQLV